MSRSRAGGGSALAVGFGAPPASGFAAGSGSVRGGGAAALAEAAGRGSGAGEAAAAGEGAATCSEGAGFCGPASVRAGGSTQRAWAMAADAATPTNNARATRHAPDLVLNAVTFLRAARLGNEQAAFRVRRRPSECATWDARGALEATAAT
jgi:hypothetical protein